MKLLFFMSIFSACSFAQQNEQNYLSLTFGGSDFHLKDEHASPLIFNSIGITPTFQYVHKGDKGGHKCSQR